MSIEDVYKLAQLGGASLALSLFVVLLALWRGWLELGPPARREAAMLTKYGEQMKAERDAFKAQVDARQAATEKALDLATSLRQYAGEREFDNREAAERERRPRRT